MLQDMMNKFLSDFNLPMPNMKREEEVCSREEEKVAKKKNGKYECAGSN